MLVPLSHAARPLSTEDARILEAKACQLESWVQINRDSREYWAQPACNFTGDFELALGGARTQDRTDARLGTRTTEVVVQAKTAFRALEPNGWSWGLVAGYARHREVDAGGFTGDVYALVPVSFSLRDDRVVLHANLGVLREKAERRTRATWALAGEADLGERVQLVAETFGQNRGRPFYQAGFRYAIVPGRVLLDASYGNRFVRDTAERWFSIGVHLESVPFLP